MENNMSRKCLLSSMRLGSAWLIILLLSLWSPNSARAVEIGKTYDKSNYQEIEDLLIEPMVNWFKKGDYIIKISEYPIDMVDHGPVFGEQTRANEGKYKFSPEGLLLHADSGELVDWRIGFPFPTIDPKDPLVAQKIMENHFARRAHTLNTASTGKVQWIGEGGHEREVIAAGNYCYYTQRLAGPIPNPKKFLKQDMTFIVTPFDLRGTVSMSWHYCDLRESTSFAYVPMLRRVRRTSSAARSDPFMGSDSCTDDAGGYGGKNADFTWKFHGQKELIVMMDNATRNVWKQNPNGSIDRQYPQVLAGYRVPGWQGAPWAPADAAWIIRPCWIVEGHSKDSYYNYGKQIFYIDPGAFHTYYKVIYDRAGEYWKTLTIGYGHATVGDAWTTWQSGTYFPVDDRTRHSTYSNVIKYPGRTWRSNAPLTDIGPQTFTVSHVLQMSK